VTTSHCMHHKPYQRSVDQSADDQRSVEGGVVNQAGLIGERERQHRSRHRDKDQLDAGDIGLVVLDLEDPEKKTSHSAMCQSSAALAHHLTGVAEAVVQSLTRPRPSPRRVVRIDANIVGAALHILPPLLLLAALVKRSIHNTTLVEALDAEACGSRASSGPGGSGGPLPTLRLKAPNALTGGPSKRCGEG
jgi:hypothetical protein